jgi:hypothetical protein
MRYQVTIHWVVALCCLVRRNQRLPGICFLHLQGIHPGSSKMLVRVQTTEHEMIPAGGVRVWRGAGTVGYRYNRLFHYHTQTGNDKHFRDVLSASTLCECFQDCHYMEHPRWCNIHTVYLCYHSHTTHSLWYGKSFRPFATECTLTHCIYISIYF